VRGEKFPAAAVQGQEHAGSFDSAVTSLREVAALLKMTILGSGQIVNFMCAVISRMRCSWPSKLRGNGKIKVKIKVKFKIKIKGSGQECPLYMGKFHASFFYRLCV
jgi:hypothetical protein